jgi:tetratricopeptide (TPR) repeat protein
MATSVAPRTARPHHTVDSEDAVLARAIAFGTWARANAQAIMVAAAIALVGAGSTLYYRYNSAQRAGKAGAEFLAVAAQARSGGNESLAARDLENFSHKYNGTVEADQARLMLGQIKLKNNQARAAIPLFQKVADGGTPIRVQGLVLLGDAQAAAGNVNGAVAAYKEAADRAKLPFEKAGALRSLAELYEQRSDYPAAATTWAQLVETAEKGSAERAEYEMRAAEAKSHTPAAK